MPLLRSAAFVLALLAAALPSAALTRDPPAFARPAELPEIRIGVLAPEGGRYDVLHRWDFIAPALERALPGHRIRLERLHVDTLRDLVRRGSAEFFIANSGFVVEMEVQNGATALATVEGPNALSPQYALGAAIIVLDSRRDLRRLADLRGQRIVAVNEQLFGGFQVGMHTLLESGVRRTDLASVHTIGFPVERLFDDLMAGRADAAVLRVCLFEQVSASPQYPASSFRVLNRPGGDALKCARSTQLYPDWAFARLKGTDPVLAKRVALALLEMPTTAQGYSWTLPTNHDRVHVVLRDLAIGPYEYLSRRDAGTLLLRYKWPLGLATLALLLLGLHSLRVKTLVTRRTAELRESLLERDRLAEEGRRREEQFEHLSRLSVLGEMSSMIAHEINQPLAAIRNYANGIVRRLQAGREEIEPLETAGRAIAEQADRAAGIMQRVRDLARKASPDATAADLRDVVGGAVALFESMAPNAPRIEVRIARDCRRAGPVFVDRLQIEQVLLNLLKNALDAMQGLEAGQRRIVVHLSCDDEDALVVVRDHGIGVAPADLPRLFEPFFTTKPEGVGLGLSVCKRIVEAHGGRMWAAPASPPPGLAVSFTLSLKRPGPSAHDRDDGGLP